MNLDKPTTVAQCSASLAGCGDHPSPAIDALDSAPEPGPDAGRPADSGFRADAADAGPGSDGGGGTGNDGAPGDPDGPGPDLSVPDLLTSGPDLTPDEAADSGAKDLEPEIPTGAPDAKAGPDLATELGAALDSAASCISAIIANDYRAGSAPACSQCHDNGTQLASKCEAMIDCLAAQGPDLTNCLNSTQSDMVVDACVTALTQAAGCPAGYY